MSPLFPFYTSNNHPGRQCHTLYEKFIIKSASMRFSILHQLDPTDQEHGNE